MAYASVDAANWHIYKTTGSQICWHSHPACIPSFSGYQICWNSHSSCVHHLTLSSEKLHSRWRASSSSVSKGISSNLVFVEDELSPLPETSADAFASRTNDTGSIESGAFSAATSDASSSVNSDAFSAAADEASSSVSSGDAFPAVTNEGSSTVNSGDAFSNGASDSVKDGLTTIKDTLSELQENSTGFFTGIKGSLTNSITKVEYSIKHVYDDANGIILRIVKGATEKYDETVSGLTSSLNPARNSSIDFTSPFRTGTPVNNSLKEVVVFVKNGAGEVFMAVGHVISDGYVFLKGLTPTEVQAGLDVAEKKVEEVRSPLSSTLQQAVDFFGSLERAVGIDPENPIVPILLFGGGSIYLGVSYWQSRYGGYAGNISANSVLELLEKERDILLVDIRPQERKQRDGVPDVRGKRRFKLASVDPIEVDGPVRKLLRNPERVNYILNATLIRNLKSVKSNTKVVIMDADGNQSRRIARALRKAGVKKPYRLEGGFASWTTYGLRQKTEAEETPLTILKEETEAVVDELKPAGIAAIALGSVASLYAFIEWEKTLQLLGAIAVVQLAYQRLNSYQSVDDLKADFRRIGKPFKLVGEWIGKQYKPTKLELATIPSTTAVQDRVVQAAAKHGSVEPSEEQLKEEEQEEESGDETPGEASPETNAA